MVGKILLLFRTIINLRFSQLFYQIYFRINRKVYVEENLEFNYTIQKIQFIGDANCLIKYERLNKFNFLNIHKHFESEINWNFSKYGKLWTYNLEYFDYLHQDNIEIGEKKKLINDFYKFSIDNKRILEPYPVSLRAINIIRFCIANELDKQYFHDCVYQELDYLNKNYEFHILGNHLLENAFALCLGGAFFGNKPWHNKAVRILRKELDEQILVDGAHFELSPMYHNIIFFRLLELIDWYSNYPDRDEDFLSFCRKKASIMRDWLENIKYENGDIPLFNDAAKGIAYPSKFLIEYAQELGIERTGKSLGDSGYRSFSNEQYEIKIDFAQIGASYQPGHAHADALSFILYHEGHPLFVEQGTSTYQIGARRDLERSTEAHNTVVVEGKNQSEVWGGFRVARRATTTIHLDKKNVLEASHDGYKKFNIIHKRKFELQENHLFIIDKLTNNGGGIYYLHLHPNRKLLQTEKNTFLIDEKISVVFDGIENLEIENYQYADSYNQYAEASRIKISFTGELKTHINFT